jgi:DNA-binding MarR family transcriptional regulator
MSEMKLKVMQTIFNLSDEWEYNIYESDDIAEYAQMDKTEVKNIMSELYDEGYLGECMSTGDDGYDTFYLNRRGRAVIGIE